MQLIACKTDDEPSKENKGEAEVTFAVDVGGSEIPYVVIETDEAIQNEPKVPATMDIYVNKEKVQTANIGIEYRGSTSFRLSDKKSYGIETWDGGGNDIDVQFFDFPEEEDFILNGHVVNMGESYIFDRTLIYHQTAYRLSEAMGNYASRTQFVEVEINGTYLGVYAFMEKLKRDNDRIDISRLEPSDTDFSGGYIVKIDKTSGGDLNLDEPLEYFENNWADDARYNEDISFRSQYDINGELLDFEPYRDPYHELQYLETYFLYEYPKAEDISAAQKEYIQNYIHDFETALISDDFSTSERSYLEYIDLDSFVDFFLINELCRNVDGYRLSTYLHKDKGGKLKLGPIWDFNIAFDNGGRIPEDGWVIYYNQYVQGDAWSMPFWWPRLMEDPVFKSAVKTRWTSLRPGALSTANIFRQIDETIAYLAENGAVERNYNKWNLGINHAEAVQSMKDFLERRAIWMDVQIGSF